MGDLVYGGLFTVMVVRVDDPNAADFESALAQQVARSPAFFANAPVVVDIGHSSGLATADAFQKLRHLFKRQHLILVGVQNANATQVRAAMNADLAAFPATGAKREAAPIPRPEPAPIAVPPAPAAAIGTRSRLVTQQVRSGTQIYARGGDLIVMSSVSPGAEVIADGHVHIYGTLRGRAIAGASGDTEARIFAGKLEAELLCVAGHYLVSEAIAPEYIGEAVQVILTDDRLTIART
ncbi:MAG: septum site-determining protein MinC [Aliidongia sp.]|jgi:septum site-determining protein MinC|nr:septum site-determining protein MinC [Aliidongia sp.]